MTAVLADDVLIVLEGRRRLRWSVCGDGWVLTGLWPDEREQALVDRYLDERRPLLIVLDYESADVPALRDELRELPRGVIVRDEDEDDDEDDLVEISVPLLDWLPPALQRRGQ